MPGKVWFVGAGPGDPDLITVKGRALLERAGAILFAGSLVDVAATLYAPDGCEIRDSKDMTLEEMTVWLLDAAARHDTVVRLQTGDPSLYGRASLRGFHRTRGRSTRQVSLGPWCPACPRPWPRPPPLAKP